MNKADKILKDAAKITGELYLAYGYVQTPMQALSFYCQSEPSDFTRRSISPARACACATAKWWNLGQAVSLRHVKIPAILRQARLIFKSALGCRKPIYLTKRRYDGVAGGL
ncbi:hypothetical protein [uncultured Campylobacter sp.]|uniref:hypothetical protein n=1 Tax=uncultured Campylobacter sp. TaxID=218934 RepID=UPI00260FB49B|nr:hypothetical protein [uncultured Campylobacter sp.]